MRKETVTDPTAGERARRAALHPDVQHPVVDPTDPRSEAGAFAPGHPEVDEPPAEDRPSPRI